MRAPLLLKKIFQPVSAVSRWVSLIKPINASYQPLKCYQYTVEHVFYRPTSHQFDGRRPYDLSLLSMKPRRISWARLIHGYPLTGIFLPTQRGTSCLFNENISISHPYYSHHLWGACSAYRQRALRFLHDRRLIIGVCTAVCVLGASAAVASPCDSGFNITGNTRCLHHRKSPYLCQSAWWVLPLQRRLMRFD